MGAAASTGKESRKKSETKRFLLIHQVEKFVINVYACCPRKESMNLVLSSDMASKAFLNFVKSERAEEIYGLYTEAIRLSECRKRNIKIYEMTKEFRRLVETYVNPETATTQVMISLSLRDMLIQAMEDDIDDVNYIDTMIFNCCRIIEETIFIMARDQFHRFILSKYYKSWRSAESSHARATTAETITPVPVKHPVAVSRAKSISDQLSWSGGKKKEKKDQDLSVRAFMNVDIKEISRLLGSESWLAALVAAAEGLALSFSLATARKDRRGFPLLYVNKYFEKVTGFPRNEVIGKNCKFLQSTTETDKDQIQKMHDALKNKMAVTVVLQNRTFSGKLFKNLVSIKPVFDSAGEYRYVIGIQIDVSGEVDECVSRIKLVEGLMGMLPSELMNDDED